MIKTLFLRKKSHFAFPHISHHFRTEIPHPKLPPLFITNDNPSAAGKASQSKAPREMVAASVPLIGLSRFTCEGPFLSEHTNRG
jgi:hypothetical protein